MTATFKLRLNAGQTGVIVLDGLLSLEEPRVGQSTKIGRKTMATRGSGAAFIGLAISFLTLGAAATAQNTNNNNALHDAVLKACAADQQKFCAGKEGQEGHMCMEKALPNASAACQQAIATFLASQPKPPSDAPKPPAR
jgi:hypothetical protein